MDPRKRWLTLATAALAVLVTTITTAGAHQPGSKAADVEHDQAVTLITGDKVILKGGDSRRLEIVRGKGREHVVFRTNRTAGRLLVIPMDVSAALNAGRLDARLFDVTGLIKLGYDDAHTAAIPLLITYDGQPRARLLPGATVTRQLPTIGGAAVQVPKTGDFLTGLNKHRSATGIAKIWLDGKRQPSLDQSVPQIGAPAAWQAGYTGKGVKVAVLDTGIDNTHPDLSDRIAGRKNFTEDPDGDQVGHGTHVASTIAGSGKASGGRYRGVAPDATLLDGEVCEVGGCPDSAIIAGMEWAVQQGAKVVNLSLGGFDGPEVDPMEEAVNRLTASSGVLFVIAAGNEGESGPGTIDSPGSAEAALTVGAVDKQDALAYFSSRGPRAGGGVIKPDLTAPGVDIVAARADGSDLGEPVGEDYQRLSGTSMATPHVAGSAALLAQEHPLWKAAELKGILTSTAKPMPGQGSFDQGAGRVDVGQAITGQLIAAGNLDFGKALWPHTDDKPVTRKLTYRNLGSKSMTLALNVTAESAGKPAPAGFFKLSATSLTIAAGGTGSVSVSSDTRLGGPDGLYSGRVVAATAGHSIVAPLALEKEIESYDVTIRHLGPDGRPTVSLYTLMAGIDTSFAADIETDQQGVAKLRVPKGRYIIDGALTTESGHAYQLVWPSLEVDHTLTVAVDARRTKPVTMTVPKVGAKPVAIEFSYVRQALEFPAQNTMTAFELGELSVASMGPAAPADQMTSWVYTRWAAPGKAGTFYNSPYTYDLLRTRHGSYFDGYHRTVRAGELATVVSQYAADRPGDVGEEDRSSPFPELDNGTSVQPVRFDLPARVVHYLDADRQWAAEIQSVVVHPDGDEYPSLLQEGPRSFKAGRTYAERWGAAVTTPIFEAGRSARTGNTLDFGMTPASDQDGHEGLSLWLDEGSETRLFRNGKLVGTEAWPGEISVANLPPGKASYRLETTLVRQLLQLGPKVDYAWTFESAKTDEAVVLPLRTVRFLPVVDAHNAVQRRAISVLPLRIEQEAGATLPAVKKVAVEVSGDSGKTWTKAVVRVGPRNTGVAVFATPKGAGVISLRAVVTDRAGNTSAQQVIDAYRLR